MEISGNFNMKVGKIQIPADSTNDGQQIWVDGEIKITPEDAKTKFGDAFHYVAFATMHEAVDHSPPKEDSEEDSGDATVVRFGYDKVKVPKWLIPTLHHIELWGVKQQTQPEIRKIIAGDNEKAVTLQMRFVFDTNRDEALIGKLGSKSGTTAKVKMKPVQTAAIQKGNGKAVAA